MNKALAIRLVLFKDSEKSFIAALDAQGISHGRANIFSTEPQASGVVEIITAISEAMPWNTLSKVIVEWIKARKSRRVILTTEDNQIFYAEGYSANEVEKMLSKSINITAIDTKPENET